MNVLNLGMKHPDTPEGNAALFEAFSDYTDAFGRDIEALIKRYGLPTTRAARNLYQNRGLDARRGYVQLPEAKPFGPLGCVLATMEAAIAMLDDSLTKKELAEIRKRRDERRRSPERNGSGKA